jgi:HEAT repeat protein
MSESSSQVASAVLTHVSRWISTFEFVDPRHVVDTMLKLDQMHPKWKFSIISSLHSIAKSRQVVRDSIVSWAQTQLFYPTVNSNVGGATLGGGIFLPPAEANPLVKATALKIIGSVLSPKFVATASQVQEICADFTSDADSRVRLAALEALLKMHEEKFYVDFKHYRTAVIALTDDDEFVRAAALRLVWNLANTYQMQNVATVQQQQQRVIPLADDAFLKICSMATDIVIPIRVEACELLGSLQGVSAPLLHQALSKKMVKVDIVPKSAASSAKDKIKSTEEGEMDADAMAAGEVDVVQVSAAAALIESGSYGALIHALEDEFAEVRCAAVKTIATLSLRSEEFAAQSLEFLVDMFNDENELVRVITINSLERFGERARLAFPQIQHMLALLGDQSSSLRGAVRSFLASDTQRLPDPAALVACVNTLLHNLLMYPSDFVSVFKTLMKIGARHPTYVELSLDKLLPEIYLHPPLQRHIDELEYQAILVVVFNALPHRAPSLLSVLPLNFQNHYMIMRDRHPSFVPCIDSLEIWAPQQLVAREYLKRVHAADPVAPEFNNVHTRDGLLAELASCSRYINQALRLTKAVPLDPSVEHRGLILYGAVTSRLQRITDIIHRRNEASSDDALPHFGHVEPMDVLPFAMWNIADILRDFLGLTVALADSSAPIPVLEWTKKIIHKTYVVQALFTNLPERLQQMLYRWRLHAHLALVFDLTLRFKDKVPPLSLDVAIATLQRRLRSDLVPPAIAQAIQELATNPQDLLDELDQILSFKISSWDVLFWPFDSLQEPDWQPVRHIFGKLVSPLSNPHHPVEFIAGLPFELRIEGSVSGVANLASVLLRIRSPNGKHQLLAPSFDEKTRPSGERKDTVSFTHTLLVQEQKWPKGAFLEVDVVMNTATDLDSLDSSSAKIPTSDWESSKELISLLGEASKVYASSRRSFPSIRT